MADLKEMIDVQIDVKNVSPVTEEFDLMLILGSHKVFTQLFRVYGDVSAMIADGFKTTDPEYIAASRVFEQDLTVNQIYVGNRASDSLLATVKTALPLTTYHSKVNTNAYSYTTGQAPTAQIIAGSMVFALSSDAVVNAYNNNDGSYNVSSKTPGVNFDVTLDADQTYLVGKALVTVDTVVDNTDYTTVIAGTTYTFNSGVGATAISIAAGLAAQMIADPGVIATDHLDGTYTLTSKVANTFFSLTVDANQSYQVEKIKVSVSVVAPLHVYSTQINLVNHTYTSGAAPTVASIAAGLIAGMGADPAVDVTDNLDGTYTVTNKVPGTAYTFLTDDNQSIAITHLRTIVEDVVAIQALDNTWFGLAETSHVKSDVLLLADWCEVERKLFGTVSNDADIINKTLAEDITSIPAILRGLNYRFTFAIYNATPAAFAETALMGRQLARTPGSSTWANKTLNGVTADNLSPTQSKNALDKQCNTYEKMAGVSIVRDGTVFDNKYKYLDVVRDLEWLKAAIQRELFTVTVDSEKIPYTDAGITVYAGYLQKDLDISVGMNILSSSPAPVVIAPLAKDVPLIDKQNRILHNLNFTGTLANAIHKVQVRGTVSF